MITDQDAETEHAKRGLHIVIHGIRKIIHHADELGIRTAVRGVIKLIIGQTEIINALDILILGGGTFPIRADKEPDEILHKETDLTLIESHVSKPRLKLRDTVVSEIHSVIIAHITYFCN